MNNDDSSSLDGLARARRQRLRELDERRQVILRRAAAQAVSTDATLAAALASLPSSLPSSNRAGHLDSLLAASPFTSASRSIADPLTGGYVPGSSLTRSYLGSTSSPLGARLDELRIVSLASELAANTSATNPSVRASTSLLPSSRPSCLSGLSIALPNTTLAQFPLNERLQLSHHHIPTVDNSHRLKRRRHEDLLKRARETMMLKPGKKAKLLLDEEEEEEEKQHDAPTAHEEEESSQLVAEQQDKSFLPAVSWKQRTTGGQLHEFPLPPLATTTGEGGAPEGSSRGLGVSLLSYRQLWNNMGGHGRKELFQKRVQNARVPMMRRRRFLATRNKVRMRTPEETAATSNSNEES